ncbi:hypothetical protein GFM18_20160 [Rhizobium laguerreae]|nr:hypothetical protein [Rhizobium laguerreae]
MAVAFLAEDFVPRNDNISYMRGPQPGPDGLVGFICVLTAACLAVTVASSSPATQERFGKYSYLLIMFVIAVLIALATASLGINTSALNASQKRQPNLAHCSFQYQQWSVNGGAIKCLVAGAEDALEAVAAKDAAGEKAPSINDRLNVVS